MTSSSPFKWRHFEPEIIVCGVRWYLRYALGSDVHVMLALRRSPREVVMTYEELDGTDMVGELLRE